MVDISITTNASNVAEFFRRLEEQVNLTRSELLSDIGRDLVENTKRRIRTANDGQWTPPSKWVMAKKGVTQALVGTDKYVKFRLLRDNLELYADIPGDWTFEQHEKGFKNVPEDKGDKKVGERVVLTLVDPAPLRITRNTFAFVPHRGGQVPPRQVWPNSEQTMAIVTPLASKWLRLAVERAQA